VTTQDAVPIPAVGLEEKPADPASAAPLDPAVALPELLASLEVQRTTVERLERLASRQAELVESGRTDALVGLLAERGRLVEAFVADQSRSAALAAALAAGRDRVAAADRAEVDARVRALEAAVARVLARDAEDQARLARRRDEAARQVRAVDAGRSALAAYGGGLGARPGPRLADRRG